MQKKSKKILMVPLLLTLILSGCDRNLLSSDNSNSSYNSLSSEPLSSDVSSSSEDEKSSNSDESSEKSSEDVPSSEVPSSEHSSEVSSEPSSEIGTSTPPPSSETPPPDDHYLDELYYSRYEYDEKGYNIPLNIPSANPYLGIDTDNEKNAFYTNNYNRATSYEDAMFRTAQGLVSGDIRDTPQDEDYPLNHLPNRTHKILSRYRTNDTNYEYDTNGNFKAYTINNLNGKTKKIYYGAAYVSLEDVAAYLFAFGRGPANYETAKTSSAINRAINNWGTYGRVNDAWYSSDVTEYKYEAMLPYTDNGGVTYYDEMYDYHELDFGFTQTPWGYGIPSYEPYNNGDSITRGTVRFVYTAKRQDTKEWGAQYIPVEHRHVFLTFNHYNDFVEYLNYESGWGAPFGWMTAGNDYVAGMRSSGYGPGYYDFIDPYPQTQHSFPTLKSLSDLVSLVSL